MASILLCGLRKMVRLRQRRTASDKSQPHRLPALAVVVHPYLHPWQATYLEAMKMETEVRAASAGTVTDIAVKNGDAVSAGDTLMTLER